MIARLLSILTLVVMSSSALAQSAQPLANNQSDSKPFFMKMFKRDPASTGTGGVFNPVTPQVTAKKAATASAPLQSPQALYEQARHIEEQNVSTIRAKASAKAQQKAAQRRAARAAAEQLAAREGQMQPVPASVGGVPGQTMPVQSVTPGVTTPAPVMVYEDPNKKETKPKPVFGFSR